MHALVVVVPSQSSIQTAEEGFSWHMPMRLHPFLDPLARPLQCLARGAAFDTRHALAVLLPKACEAHDGEPTPQA